MSCYPSLETHPLKCMRLSEGFNSQKVILGPPDVYQQESRQKEDLLTEFNVREGFNYSKPVMEEHESAKDLGFEFISKPFLSDLNNYMQAVIVKSHNNNIKPDTTKRKATVATIYKDLQCIPALEKSKEIIYEWMVNLADTVPYAELINKRIPYFHKKEDVLKEIFRYQVPITRAIWFIKVSAMHATIQAESNKKKTRSNVDSSSDWVVSFTRILSEKLDIIHNKLNHENIDNEYEMSVSEFEYFMRLMVAMYDEDLLDHTEVLQWLVTNNERCADDDQMMKFYLPFLLFFGDRFKESEILTRRLLFGACNSLNLLLTSNKHQDRSITDYYSEYSNCPQHRTIIFCLSGLIISLSLECPCAVIYNNVKIPGHYLNGSPLDNLSCSLTALPSPPGPENELLRETVAKLEKFVLERSLGVENQWKHESFECPIEQTATSLIKVLDLLDRYDYNSYKDTNEIESLSESITASIDNHRLLLMVLCEWAVTTQRTGPHRSIIIAHVIEYFQKSIGTSIQDLLIEFLDTKAPYIDPGFLTTVDSESFRNLVCLFGELIEREIFSPNEYMSYMIARGLFESVSNLPLGPIGGIGTMVVARSPAEPDRNSTDNPDSVRSEASQSASAGPVTMTTMPPGLEKPATQSSVDYRQYNRHLQYLIHFPIPQNEDYLHEHNLRTQKLYSSSRTRDANRQFLRRLAKDIGKLFSKRGYMFDVIQADKLTGLAPTPLLPPSSMGSLSSSSSSRKKSRRDPRDDLALIDRLAESIQSRFRALSYYDMESVLSQSVAGCVNSLNVHAVLASKTQSMSNMFLPYPRIVAVVLGLVELSCNYTSLIRIIDECAVNLTKLIEHLSRAGLVPSAMPLLVSYCSYFRVAVIGYLLKYQSVLMFMNESRGRIFQAVFSMVRNVAPVGASTHVYVNRCTFLLIYTLYQSCSLLRTQVNLAPFIKKVESSLFRMIKPDRERASSIEYQDALGLDLLRAAGPASVGPDLLVELQGNVSARLSFVVNAISAISHCTDLDQLIRINSVIVDSAVTVPSLSAEWMTALFSLLMPFNALPGYEPFAAQFQALLHGHEPVFYENISALIATLLARQCFTFIDFLSKVICVVMAQGIDQQSMVSPGVVPTTRLASYILYRLFTMDQSVAATAQTAFRPEDVNLLSASLQKVSTELLVDLLKMLAVHSDKGRLQDQDVFDLADNGAVCFLGPLYHPKRPTGGPCSKDPPPPPTLSVIALSNGIPDDSSTNNSLVAMKIWNFTLRVLREICCVSWVRIKFSQETPSRLIRDNVLIDKNISNSQARNLLNIICHPRDHLWQTSCTSRDIIDTMNRTFAGLDLWSLHYDQMKIQLLLTQIPEDERKDVIETVSRDIIGLFKTEAELRQPHQNRTGSGAAAAPDESDRSTRIGSSAIEISSAFLIPTLIGKLPFDNFKRHLVLAASEKLESGKHFCTHKNYQDKENDLTKSSLILTYPPFVSLLVVCLGRDENKQDLLKSLADQIEYYIDNARETEKMPDDLRVKHLIHTSMRSRLALVGYLFDRIQDSIELISDWCLLLSKLIIYGVVEMHSDHSLLFYTVLDMISSLVHTLFSQPNVGPRFAQTIKKLRKEICDKLNYEGVELIKPFLLPCFKNCYDIVVTVPLRMAHKSAAQQQYHRLTLAEKSGKQGCAVQRKERLNPWEVIEGVKSLLSLSWFGAVGCDPPVLPIEEQANLMIGHDHPNKAVRGDHYYIGNPEIPHEDVKDVSLGPAEITMQELINTSGPPSVQTAINTANSIGFELGSRDNSSNPTGAGAKQLHQDHQTTAQRPRSNASSGTTAKRPKKTKRSVVTQSSSGNIGPTGNSHQGVAGPGHVMSRAVTSPAIHAANQNMMIRHPGVAMVAQNPAGPLGIGLGHGPYSSHPIEYGNYSGHQIVPMMSDLQQHPGYMSRQQQQQQHFTAQNVFDNPGRNSGLGVVRSNRMPRPNIVTQNLKTKIQQRQPPQSDQSIHGSFHTGQPQQPLPPPYPSNSNPNPHDDLSSMTPGPPPNYSGMTANSAIMNQYPMQRTYSDQSMQYIVQQQQQQQQARHHPQPFNHRYSGQY